MRVGFTGTQLGMSEHQKEQFVLNMLNLNPQLFIHGDCIGADAEAHDIVRAFFPDVSIVIFPPKINSKRAFKKGDVIMEPDDYLVRNKLIVDHSDYIFGAPKADEEELRSGTWSTIRYARKQNIPLTVLTR